MPLVMEWGPVTKPKRFPRSAALDEALREDGVPLSSSSSDLWLEFCLSLPEFWVSLPEFDDPLLLSVMSETLDAVLSRDC